MIVENLVDSVGDFGLVLADGTELSYANLSRILGELADANLLRCFAPHANVGVVADNLRLASESLQQIARPTQPCERRSIRIEFANEEDLEEALPDQSGWERARCSVYKVLNENEFTELCKRLWEREILATIQIHDVY